MSVRSHPRGESTLVDSEDLSPVGVVEAIRAGRVTPVVRTSRGTRYLQRLYTRIHRFRGHLDPSTDAER